MNADLHHQLHNLFDEQAHELDPTVPDHFDPARPTALTTDHRPDRRRPLLGAAAAITLAVTATVILTQRHPDVGNTPGPGTTQPTSDTTTTTNPPTTSVAPSLDGAIPPSVTLLDEVAISQNTTVRFVPNSRQLLVGDATGAAPDAIVDLDSRVVVREFVGEQVTAPKLFNVDGTRYFNGQRLFDVSSGRELWAASEVADAAEPPHAESAAFSPDGRRLVVMVLTSQFGLHLIDASVGSLVWSASFDSFIGSGGPNQPERVRFSDDGSRVFFATAIHDAATGVRLPGSGTAPPPVRPSAGFWDPAQLRALGVDACDPTPAAARCDISADGSKFAWIDPDRGAIDIWELDSLPDEARDPIETNAVVPADTLRRLDTEGSGNGIDPTVAYSTADFDIGTMFIRLVPGGESFLVGDPNGKALAIFETDSGRLVRRFPGWESFGPVVFDARGTRLFDGFRLWDLTTGEVISEWGGTYAAGFSPDGASLAIGSSSGEISLVDATDGSTRWTRSGADRLLPFSRLRFSDDGSRLAVGGSQYDATTGELDLASSATFSVVDTGYWNPAAVEALDSYSTTCDPATSPPPFSCDITDDGSHLAFISQGTIQIWETDV